MKRSGSDAGLVMVGAIMLLFVAIVLFVLIRAIS